MSVLEYPYFTSPNKIYKLEYENLSSFMKLQHYKNDLMTSLEFPMDVTFIEKVTVKYRIIVVKKIFFLHDTTYSSILQ